MQSELGRYYQVGKYPPSNMMFKGKEEVTPHPEVTATPNTVHIDVRVVIIVDTSMQD